jgi:serine/threonine protein kinase
MAKEQTSSLEGQFLDPLTQKWLISKKIGEGACASVYNLVRNRTSSKTSSSTTGISTEYAVKVAKLPPPSTNMKRKKTLLEINADLLNHENVLYRNILNNLRGTMVPDVPIAAGSKGPSGFGEIGGYRYLVMEKMDSPFSSIVAIIADNQSSLCTGDIPIGPIAERIVRLIEALHAAHVLFVDVKPENFMLAPCSTAASQRIGKYTDSHIKLIADRIRMIDFGLVQSFKDAVKNKHRMDMFPNGPVVGTPVYASLNVLSGHTISRRDDLESCFYLLVELLLQIVAYQSDNNNTQSSRRKIQMDLLPWSKGKSDEEIKKLKEDTMSDQGIIWKLLANHGNEELSLRMKEIYGLIRSLDFKEKPNYDEIASLMGRLKIKVDVVNRKSKSNRRSGASSSSTSGSLKRESTTPTNINTKRDSKRINRTTTPNTSCQSLSSPLYDEDVMPIPVVASTRASRAAARATAKESLNFYEQPNVTRPRRMNDNNNNNNKFKQDDDDDDDDDVEMISVVDALNKSDEDSVTVVRRGGGGNHDNSMDVMDWELVTNENKAFVSNLRDESKSTKSIDKPHLYLECIDGPHTGESFILTDTLLLGSNPSTTRRKEASVIIKDTSASANHARLALNQTGSKKSCILMVKVFDLNSNSGTFINGKVLPKGSSRQAFVNDRIKVGKSTFQILKRKGSA